MTYVEKCSPATEDNENALLSRSIEASGRASLVTAKGDQVWTPGVRGELQRLPMECTEPVDPRTIRMVLARPGIRIASFMLAPSEASPANCFDYVCADPEYDVEKLTKNGRRDVRRGLRCFEVRPCPWDQLADKGLQAFVDTELRHEHDRPGVQELNEIAKRDCNCSQIGIWGAWRGGELAAWLRLVKGNGWALISHAYSRVADLKDCPNNALAYEVTRKMLVEEKRSTISYGISSLQRTPNILSLHRFKLRMGYQAIPMRRTFVLQPMLRPVFQTKAGSRLLDLAAKLRPGSASLVKAAGLARMLSNREVNPLGWLQEDAAED